MELTEIATIFRLCVGALATFFAIILWSKTRDPAWILVILSVFITYVEIIITTLENFKILNGRTFIIQGELGFGIFKMIIINLPVILIITAFIIIIVRKRIP
jgi:hypothetical protein